MINLHKSMGLGQDQTRTPGSAVRLTSAARHVTDCAMRPGNRDSCTPCCEKAIKLNKS